MVKTMASVMTMVLWVFASTSPEEAVLARVQTTYKKAGDIEARFAQTYVEKLRGRGRTESGRLWTKPDGRVRWQYENPEPKYFIYDGENAHFYEPAHGQVTIFREFSESQWSNALRFLWGRGPLSEVFHVGACTTACAFGASTDKRILLRPKEPLASVDRLLLVVEPTSWRVKMSVVFDALGNRTEYAFSDVRFDAKLPASKFRFKKPEGVQELVANPEEPSSAAKNKK